MAEAPAGPGDSAPGVSGAGGAPGTGGTGGARGAGSAPGTGGTGGARGAGSAPGSRARVLGVREALLVGELVVVVVLLAGVATYLLPADARDVILRTPLLILVLIVGTAAVLWRISRPGGADR